jgi:hypothetical protein
MVGIVLAVIVLVMSLLRVVTVLVMVMKLRPVALKIVHQVLNVAHANLIGQPMAVNAVILHGLNLE